jgi:hypothetical protein
MATVGFVTVSVAFVSAGDMSTKPEPLLTCHFTEGVGEPLAAAVNVAFAPYVTV